MNNIKYIALDTETGGTDPKQHSLLTLYVGIYNNSLELIHGNHFKFKHPVYHVTAEGMNINKINLLELDKEGHGFSLAGQKLFNMLKQHSEKGANKLIPIGHNVKFDIGYVIDSGLLSKGNWEQFVSYRTLDTGIIAQFLKIAGKMPQDISGSLGSLSSFYGVKAEGALHDAEVDTKVTVEVLRNMIKSI